ncbi:hypothetical protein C8F04DRAFT_1327882 [Mycena alexandri]|uniref:Uncharacterized protein n=1 Tax=Mycena alexandri TaxID=1745969 RepID=A0AAD6T544_9AGAR|nr:hypothetical protein C8F04DRAFT_1327882 [Mycena alexandri]
MLSDVDSRIRTGMFRHRAAVMRSSTESHNACKSRRDMTVFLVGSTFGASQKRAHLSGSLKSPLYLLTMVRVVTAPPENPSRDDIIWLAGPRLVGLNLNWWLLGALAVQVYVYHVNFPKDKRIRKPSYMLFHLLDWAQTSSATYDAFQWFVYGWGSILAMFEIFSSFLNVPALSSVIGAIVQIFFRWRIFSLSKSWITFAAIIFLALLQLGGGGAVSYYVSLYPEHFRQKKAHPFLDASEVTRADGLVRAVGVRLRVSAAVDTLVRSRNQVLTGMNTVITRVHLMEVKIETESPQVVQLTIETGTITALAAIMDLIFFLKAHNGLHQVSGVTLCKFYSNTHLVLFNNRLALTRETVITVHGSTSQLWLSRLLRQILVHPSRMWIWNGINLTP